ncbi:hypothetical protein DVA76_17575, partial [Acinetobacter baumannii]
MTGDKAKFNSLSSIDGGHVKFGGGAKEKIIGIGNVGKEDSTCINEVLLVDGLKSNLISISQLCDKGHRVIFESKSCKVERIKDNTVVFTGHRDNNIYTISCEDLNSHNVDCLSAVTNESWLWHRRLEHVGLDLISKL